jgi:predicted PurR-regulated permease PerM
MSRAEFIKRTFIVVGIALVPVLVWYLFDVILIIMGALLISELLDLGATPSRRWLGLPQNVSLALSGLVILAVFGGGAYLFGTRMAAELQDVIQRASSGQNSIVNAIQGSDIGKLLLSHMPNSGEFISNLPSVFTGSAGFLAGVIVTIIAGVFLAAQPDLYKSGLVQLFPPRQHRRAKETIDDVASALRLWLRGQLIQMAIIGVLSTLAVWLIGLPSPLAFGVIAAIAEFIPYLGPIIAAVPAVLVAATQGFDAVIWTVVAYTLIHQVEGHLVMPFIQRRMVYIPPAVFLLAIAAIGSLFGLLAITLASPMTVVLFVLIKKLYVRDTLGEESPLPGEPQNGAAGEESKRALRPRAAGSRNP